VFGFIFYGDRLSRMVVEILRLKRLAKHFPIENALIPTFVSEVKIGGYSILQLCASCRSLARNLSSWSTSLVTAVFGLSH